MRRPLKLRARHGWTVIEMVITVGVAAILAAIALPNIDFNKFKMDGACRGVQLRFIHAQSKAVEGQVNYILTFFWNQDQFRVVNDQNGNGLWDGGTELVSWFTLPEGVHFLVPPTTIDGATPNYATGPGATATSDAGPNYPTVTFFPNGSSSGDVTVYIGTSAAKLSDFRAIHVTGSTSKVAYWRMQKDGTWAHSDM
jgi:type II secretory pathway pseudopilin PulG